MFVRHTTRVGIFYVFYARARLLLHFTGFYSAELWLFMVISMIISPDHKYALILGNPRVIEGMNNYA